MDRIPDDFVDDEELDNVMTDVLKDDKPVASSRKRPRSSLSKSPFEGMSGKQRMETMATMYRDSPVPNIRIGSPPGPAEMKKIKSALMAMPIDDKKSDVASSGNTQNWFNSDRKSPKTTGGKRKSLRTTKRRHHKMKSKRSRKNKKTRKVKRGRK
jgi:hypothetical protein